MNINLITKFVQIMGLVASTSIISACSTNQVLHHSFHSEEPQNTSSAPAPAIISVDDNSVISREDLGKFRRKHLDQVQATMNSNIQGFGFSKPNLSYNDALDYATIMAADDLSTKVYGGKLESVVTSEEHYDASDKTYRSRANRSISFSMHNRLAYRQIYFDYDETTQTAFVIIELSQAADNQIGE